MNPALAKDLRSLKGVGPRRQALLEALGLRTMADLLTFFPSRYLTNNEVRFIADMTVSETTLLQVEVCGSAKVDYIGGQRSVLRLPVRDSSAASQAVWFNQAYRRRQFPQGSRIWLRARLEIFHGRRSLNVHECGLGDAPEPGLQPVYALRGLLAQKQYRKFVKQALEVFQKESNFDPWSLELRRSWSLVDLNIALRQMHQPASISELEQARRRLAMDEVALNHAISLMGRRNNYGLAQLGEVLRETAWRRSLPYRLTDAQERCIAEIGAEQAAVVPMRRLLQGDVGAGKTVVAAAAALRAAYSGYQAALMAPTEILALQHYASLRRLLPNCVPVHLVIAGGGSERRRSREAASAGMPGLWIGTQALLSEGMHFPQLGLVIIDEQHRFGVAQREKLLQSREPVPDLLCLSATPIPRSLALALYGNMSVSTLDQRPSNRAGVTTVWLQDAERLPRFVDYCASELKLGHKVYWVCPSIENEAELQLASLYEREPVLRRFWPDAALDLLHGKLTETERSRIMNKFLRDETDVLLGTTVIEVGVDQPLATVMVIENAERFGLAQLHQLRGRVGRGDAPGYCVLLSCTIEQLQNGESQELTPQARDRLKALCESDDGFALARLDLELRGPGEVFGLAQSGFNDNFALRWPLSLEDVERIDCHLQTLQSDELEALAAWLNYLAEPQGR